MGEPVQIGRIEKCIRVRGVRIDLLWCNPDWLGTAGERNGEVKLGAPTIPPSGVSEAPKPDSNASPFDGFHG